MEHTPIPQILILVATAVCMVGLFRSVRLSPVLGYLVAGALIGPHGVAWIRDVEDTAAIAELGVIFLLFIIGLELSFARLKAMRRQVFGIGSAQLILCGVAITLMANFHGFEWHLAVIIGGGLALSSTALVIQMLEESRQRGSQVGRIALAILIMQDLAVMPLLVMIPLMAQPQDEMLLIAGMTMLKAFVAMVSIVILGRLILRPLYRVIASLHNEELFVATTLLVVLGVSWLTESIGLSLALGAFLAGLLMAETEFQHQVESDIRPYKGLLMGLFFMTIGMRMDITMMLAQVDIVVLAVVLLLSVKAMIIWILLRVFRYTNGVAIHTALLLSQGGEFGFVLFSLAGQTGAMNNAVAELLLVIVSVTMALTPVLAGIGQRIAARLTPETDAKILKPDDSMANMQGHVVVAGFGRMGTLVTALLESEHITYVALESDATQVQRARKAGKLVFYGDATRHDVLEHLGTKGARAIIITFKNDKLNEKLVSLLRRNYPTIPIICRARDVEDAVSIEEAGAHYAVPELFEGSLQLGASLLRVLEIPDREIHEVIQRYRDEAYKLYDPQQCTRPA